MFDGSRYKLFATQLKEQGFEVKKMKRNVKEAAMLVDRHVDDFTLHSIRHKAVKWRK